MAVENPPSIDSKATGKEKLRMKSAAREIVETILLTLLIFLAVRAVVQNFKVEGSSMEPNLHSGQYLLVNKAVYFSIDLSALPSWLPIPRPAEPTRIYLFHPPQRGDVVVFRYPRDPGRDFIKRVIAVPGQTVEVRAGRIFVDGQEIAEPYIKDRPNYSQPPEKVPEGEYYVLGDNRNNSSDSHVWGTVPRENIIGKAWVSYWPISDWGLVPNYSPAANATK
jgi:signal peptidase I